MRCKHHTAVQVQVPMTIAFRAYPAQHLPNLLSPCRRYEQLFSDTIPEEQARQRQDKLQDKVRALILRKDPPKPKAPAAAAGAKGVAKEALRPAPHRMVNPLSTIGGGGNAYSGGQGSVTSAQHPVEQQQHDRWECCSARPSLQIVLGTLTARFLRYRGLLLLLPLNAGELCGMKEAQAAQPVQ